jgi:pyridoxal phosphate enzyme (YggS family)
VTSAGTSGPAGAQRDRSADIAGGIAAVRARIEQAATAAGRDPALVTVVVVTKTFPVSDVRALHALGVRDVGENRDQEAAPKAQQCADLDLRWHFVGQLQTNKAASVATYASVVHSVDRPRLVAAMDAAAHRAGRELDVLVQVDLDERAPAVGRGGAAPGDLPALADAVATTEALRLRGLMAVAPLGQDPEPAFARLAALAAELRAAHPAATWVSAGMSDDLEAAVAAGATHVRVGSAILGHRPPLR